MPSGRSKRKETTVVGAGISGLITAYALRRREEPVCVLEAGNRPGGVIRSEQVDSFLFEYGPNSLLKKSKEVRWLIDSLDLGHLVQVAGDHADRRYVVRDGRLHEVPMNVSSFLSTDLLSWTGKGSLLLEPFRKPGGRPGDESLASFVMRRLGSEALTYLVDPMIAGIYAGSPERLSARSSAEKFANWEREYGSILKGMAATRLEQPGSDQVEDDVSRELISFQGGLETLVRRIGDRLSGSIRYHHRVKSIEPMSAGNGFRIRVDAPDREETSVIESDRVVLTVPAGTAADLLQPVDRDRSSALDELYYPPLAVVLFGYEEYSGEHPLNGFGFLVPGVEERNILGTLWNASIFPDRAPEGGAVLTTFVGGARQPELARKDRDELIDCVRDDLNDLIGLEKQPDVVRVKQWERAIPQYEQGHRNVVRQIEEIEADHPGLFIHGNYRGGISLPACIRKGVNFAGRIAESELPGS